MQGSRIVCRTALDSAKFEEWPTEFARVPMVGESVQAKSGRKLRVASVTHSMYKLGDRDPGVPYVDVELHLYPGETVADDVAKHRR